MQKEKLKFGNDINHLKLIVSDIAIESTTNQNSKLGLIIKLDNYNLEDLLIQLIDDYGEDELISKIKDID